MAGLTAEEEADVARASMMGVECTVDVLRAYASIFSKPRRDKKDGPRRQASNICLMAAGALEMFAALLEEHPEVARELARKMRNKRMAEYERRLRERHGVIHVQPVRD